MRATHHEGQSDHPQSDHPIVYRSVDGQRQLADLTTPERLIEAGWRASDEVTLAKAFPGTTASAVSKAAGVTTGSFFHHFANAEEFARTMALDMADSSAASTPEDLVALATREASAPTVDLRELARDIMGYMWSQFTDDPENLTRFRCEMRLFSHYHVPLSDDPHDTIGAAIRASYLRGQQRSIRLWQPALDQSAMEIAPPFTREEAATVLSALFEGLVLRACVDPDSVAPTLFGDAAAAFLTGAIRPAGTPVTLDEGHFELKPLADHKSHQARSGTQRRFETRSKIIAACTGMFSNGWEAISTSDVATRAGVSPQTVTNLFGTVRGVAAATFAPQAQRMYQNALSRSKDDPWTGLRETLVDLTVRSRTDREVARALLAERVQSATERGGSIGEMDVRLEVPISGALGLWLGRMGLGGERGIRTSATLANFVLTQAIVSPDPADEVASLAFRLVPEEATSKAGVGRY